MTPEFTHVRILVTAEQIAELRLLIAAEPGVLTILPADDPTPLRAALAFYADPANWREGAGTGPQRAAPCAADAGRVARECLASFDTGMGYAGRRLSQDGETGLSRCGGSGDGAETSQRADLEGSR